MKRVMVVAGGEPEPTPAAIGEFALVIAADSGADQARRLGVDVDVVVGDLDSVSSDALAEAQSRGARIERHRPDKDEIDLELAFALAVEEHPDEIFLLGGAGGRLDLAAANLNLLAAAATSKAQVRAQIGGWRLCVCTPSQPWSAEGTPGELVSVVPAGGDAGGAWTTGLAYPLQGESLSWRHSRGLSNRFTGGPASLRLATGTALIFRPPAHQLIEGVVQS